MAKGILEQLNPEQRRAASVIDGPVLVLAGAGTGKTRVITFRMAHMLQRGVPPEQILAMTFTNKAAREMRERVAALVDAAAAKKLTIGTFHSFCGMVLRKEIAVLGFTPNFSIADESDQTSILKQATAELGLSPEDTPIESSRWYIGDCKNHAVDPSHAIRVADTDHYARMAHVYERYQQLLENQNMLDFDDMLFFVHRLFKDFPEILRKYQERYRYLLVDEYQDTNTVQFQIVKTLAGERRNLCVVGDDDQSIYGWRGAVVQNILDFPRQFENAVEVRLEQNYRSTNNILRSANAVIAHNTERFSKELWSAKGEGEKIKVVKAASAEAEADFIKELILQELATDSSRKHRDFAILYRSNHMSRVLELALRSAGIPYRLVGGQEFYSRKEIKDAAAYLKVLANPRDNQSFLRILGTPPRGIGDTSIKKLKQLAAETRLPMCELIGDLDFLGTIPPQARNSAAALHGVFHKYRNIFSSPGELASKAKNFLKESGYLDGFLKIYKNLAEAESRQENVMEFINSIAAFEFKAARADNEAVGLVEFLESFALLDDNDKTKEEVDDNAVTLSTVHASKGLEFPFVFIVGMEHNIFPHERSLKDDNINEELRLFYVAITRAQSRLVISHAGERLRYGENKRQIPSRFLSLLPAGLRDECKPEDLFQRMDTDDLLGELGKLKSLLFGD